MVEEYSDADLIWTGEEYPQLEEKYKSIDIVRSEVKLKSDSELSDKIIDFIKNHGWKEKQELVPLIREFYTGFLNDKLSEPDKYDAKIDLTTLAYAAARLDAVTFGHAGLTVEGDQTYQSQEKRLSWPVIGRIIGPIINRLMWNYDIKKAKERDYYEMHAHVMFGTEGLRRIEQLKKNKNDSSDSPALEEQATSENHYERPFIIDPDFLKFHDFENPDSEPPAEES